MITTYDIVHWVLIKVYDRRGGNLLQLMRWDDMRFETRNKWDWYFRYRAALAQVQHPRAYVEFAWGHGEPTAHTKVQMELNRISAKRRKITEYRNKLTKAEANWNSLFPIQEDQLYQRAVHKITCLERDLKQMEATFKLSTQENI